MKLALKGFDIGRGKGRGFAIAKKVITCEEIESTRKYHYIPVEIAKIQKRRYQMLTRL